MEGRKNKPIILVPAAGESKRFGGIKQIEPVEGVPMLRAVCNKLLRLGLGDILVVLGANSDVVGSVISDLDVQTVYNRRWEEGLGTSIAAGVMAATASEEGPSPVMVVLADQPFIPDDHFLQLVETSGRHPRNIIASLYQGRVSVPAIFPPETFERLTALSGDQGARELLRSSEAVITLALERGHEDIDTPADFG